MKKITTADEGYIVVETLFSFTMLIMVMVVIISLINIVAVQARTHYAITQTAQEMSMYAYVTTLIAPKEDYDSINSGGYEWVASAQGTLETLSSGITDFGNSIAAGMTGFFIDEYAAEIMRQLSAAPDDVARQYVMDDAVKEIFVKYLCDDLSQAETQANAYLIRAGVCDSSGTLQGLNSVSFSSSSGNISTMLDSNGDSVVTIEYKIRFNLFNVIPLPLYLDVEQSVKTKAWLYGRVQK